MRIPPPYHDRKLLKWNGFFLSEHTKQLSKEKTETNFIVPEKELMTSDEIDRTLYEARLKDRSIAIQKEVVRGSVLTLLANTILLSVGDNHALLLLF